MITRLPTLQTFRTLAALLALSTLLSGCVLLQLRQETEIGLNSTVLVGIVSGEPCRGGAPIVVAAYTKRRNIVTVGALCDASRTGTVRTDRSQRELSDRGIL